MIEHHQHISLNKLRFHGRCTHGNKRFARKDHCSFRNRVYIAGKAEILQISQKIFVKATFGAQIGNVFFVKAQIVDIFHNLFQSGNNGIAAVIRIFSVKNIKISNLVFHTLAEIAVCHGEFIIIKKHCEIARNFFHDIILSEKVDV